MGGRGTGVRYAPVPGRVNIECLPIQGPLPATAGPKDALWFLRCRVEGCGWSHITLKKRSGIDHRARRHADLGETHLYEPADEAEVKEERRKRRRANERNCRLRKKQSTVGRPGGPVWMPWPP